MQQAGNEGISGQREPHSFSPWHSELTVTKADGSALIDDAAIWIDHAMDVLHLMVSEVEAGDGESELLANRQRLQGCLYSVISSLRMAEGFVHAMPASYAQAVRP